MTPSPTEETRIDTERISHAGLSQRPPRFVSVEVELLEPGMPLHFGLYLATPRAGRVLILDGEDDFKPDFKKRLLEARAQVYVQWSERASYYAHIETNLKKMLLEQDTDTPKVARLAYELSIYAMEKVFERPEAAVLGEARETIVITADLIMHSDRAMFTLLHLARHDYYTYTHSCNVGIFSLGLVKRLIQAGQRHDVHSLGAGFFFHDLGKSMVDRGILNKPGPLDSTEWVKMRQHPDLGFKLLDATGFLTEEARHIVLQHHERFDGSGYPQGIKGEKIHPYGRICAIADVFDALTSTRTYRERIGPFQAATLMWEEMQHYFDPELLKKFILLFKDQS